MIKKSKKRSRFVAKLVYNRIIIIALLLVLQFFGLVSLIIWLKPYIQWYLGGSVVLNMIFICYLSNCGGKNEFKIAWLIPVIFFPILGIILYILFHTNGGGIWMKKELKQAQGKTITYLKDNLNQPLSSDYAEISDLEYYLKKTSNYPSYENCSVEYLPSGEKFFEDFLEKIQTAKKFIFLEFFIIAPDDCFERMVEILHLKALEGVDVRIMYDAIGSVRLSTKRNLKYLRNLGIKAEIFFPLVPFFSTTQNNRDHRKIVVIDNEICYTGGVNIADEYFNFTHPRYDYWKDSAVRLSGPCVKTFTALFLENWTITGHRKKQKENFDNFFTENDSCKQEVKGLVIPYGDDAYNREDVAENIYMYIISNAKKYVHITTPYMIVDNAMMDALYFAANRGVDVSIIVPSKPDHFITFCVGRVYIKNLISHGVKVYEYNPGFIHAKNFTSDDCHGTVGSVNLDYRSLYHHFECGVFMEKNAAVQDIEKDFQETLKDCTEITMEKWKKIPWYKRLIGHIFRVFAPLL